MDPNRMTVDRGLLHHAVTPLWEDKSKAWLAQWFSDNGYARAYGSNPANWSGLINPFTGQRSYSQTHAVGQRVTAATPDATAAERAAGYRVFYIVANPKQVITWHAGDWTMNRRSIAIENLGDYRNYPLRDGDMKVIADFFRPLDQAVGGALNVLLHFEVYATACPARIAEARDQIINYINNPPKPPAPVNPHRPVPAAVALEKPITIIAKLDKVEMWDLDTNPNYKSIKTFNKGDKIDVVAYIPFNDVKYYQTQHSFNRNKHGFNERDVDVQKAPVITTKDETTTTVIPHDSKKLDDPLLPKGEQRVEVSGQTGVRTRVTRVTFTDGKETGRAVISDTVTKEPVTEIIKVGTYVEPTPVPSRDDEQDVKINGIMDLLRAIGEAFAKFLEKFKK